MPTRAKQGRSVHLATFSAAWAAARTPDPAVRPLRPDTPGWTGGGQVQIGSGPPHPGGEFVRRITGPEVSGIDGPESGGDGTDPLDLAPQPPDQVADAVGIPR